MLAQNTPAWCWVPENYNIANVNKQAIISRVPSIAWGQPTMLLLTLLINTKIKIMNCLMNVSSQNNKLSWFSKLILQFFKPVKVDPKQHGKFYKGDSYIILEVNFKLWCA